MVQIANTEKPQEYEAARRILGNLKKVYKYGPLHCKVLAIELYERGLIYYRLPMNEAEAHIPDLYPKRLVNTRKEVEHIFKLADAVKSCNWDNYY